MTQKIKNIFSYAKKHKKITAAVLAVCIATVYGIVKTSGNTATETQYIFSKAAKNNVTISVTGSGQVSALDQVDIISEVSGTVDYIGVKEGDSVIKGKVLVHLDSSDASRAVDNAELSLTNAETAYKKAEKLYKNQLGESNTTISDLAQAMDDGYTAVSNAFIDLPKIFMDVSDIYYDPSTSPYFSDLNVLAVGSSLGLKYKYDAGITFDATRKDYEALFEKYKATPPNASQEKIVAIITETHVVVKKLSLALTGAHNTIDFLSDRMTNAIPSEVSTDKSLLSSYIAKVTGHMSKLSAALTAIEDAEDSATSAELNLKSAELTLNQTEDSLKDAKETLSDHSIVAPFDGVIAKMPLEVGDRISNGGTAATIITKAMKVTISLNEVDATKIKVGDKASLTFDAVDELSMNGTVSRIDVTGTVSNNVVSYTADISFDTTDDRIKAGMTTDIAISTGSVSDVLSISSSAISSDKTGDYVLVPFSVTNAQNTTDTTALTKKYIEVGLSGDDLTEITSGLSEGDTYVSSTIVVSEDDSSSGSLFSMFGGGKQGRQPGSSSSKSSSSSSSGSSSGSMPPNGMNGGMVGGSMMR
jgi:RND family efflux transporter MFP subunit